MSDRLEKALARLSELSGGTVAEPPAVKLAELDSAIAANRQAYKKASQAAERAHVTGQKSWSEVTQTKDTIFAAMKSTDALLEAKRKNLIEVERARLKKNVWMRPEGVSVLEFRDAIALVKKAGEAGELRELMKTAIASGDAGLIRAAALYGNSDSLASGDLMRAAAEHDENIRAQLAYEDLIYARGPSLPFGW